MAPALHEARMYLVADLLSAGAPEQALAEAERAEWPWVRLTGVAAALHDLGRARESQAAIDVLIRDDAGSAAYQIAEIYAWRGQTDLAFTWLERALAEFDSGLVWIRADPLLRSVRADARYPALIEKMRTGVVR